MVDMVNNICNKIKVTGTLQSRAAAALEGFLLWSESMVCIYIKRPKEILYLSLYYIKSFYPPIFWLRTSFVNI